MHPQRWRFLGILVGSIDRFWCITFRRVTFLPTGHFFTFLVISISRFTFGDFSHISADFSNMFINFSPTFVHLSWTFHRFCCPFCQQRIQVETFFVANVGWLLFKNKCLFIHKSQISSHKTGGKHILCSQNNYCWL